MVDYPLVAILEASYPSKMDPIKASPLVTSLEVGYPSVAVLEASCPSRTGLTGASPWEAIHQEAFP